MLGITKGMIEVSKGFENVETGLKTVTGSGEKASKVFEQIRKLSYETTFGMEELGSAATMLLNSGETTGSINDQLLMLGNLASGDKQKFMDLTNIYSKILNLGKAGTEQIQMIALRGIPIQQTLRKIGVTGTASANDIKKAFEELTKDGGNFAGAMDNLNDTIAGREDFVSDTLKEIAVNFGNLSGITDTYKSLLGLVRDALDKVNNVLIGLNGHPVVKALIGGAIAAAVTALTVVIGGTLLSAVIKLNSQLAITATLKAILDPKTLAVAAVVGGIAGISTALIKLKSDADKAADAVSGIGNNVKSPEDIVSENVSKLKEMLDSAKTEYDVAVEKYDSRKNEFDSLLLSEDDYAKELGLNKNDDNFKKNYENYKKTIEAAKPKQKEELDQLKQAADERLKNVKFYEEMLKYQTDLNEGMEEYNKLSENINSITTTLQTSSQKSLNSLMKQNSELAKLFEKDKDGWKVRVYDNDLNEWRDEVKHLSDLPNNMKDKMLEAAELFKKKIEDAQVKVVMEHSADWQQSLDKLLGLDSGTVRKFNNLSVYFDEEGNLTDKARQKITNGQQLYSSTGTFLASEQSKKNTRSQFDYVQGFNSEQIYINSLVSAIDKIRQSGEFGEGENTAYTVLQNQVKRELQSTVDFYKKGFENLDVLDKIDINGLSDGINSATIAYEQLLKSGIDPTTKYMIDFNGSIEKAKKKLTELSEASITTDFKNLFSSKIVNALQTSFNNMLREGFKGFSSAADFEELLSSLKNGLRSGITDFVGGLSKGKGILGAIVVALQQFLSALQSRAQELDGYASKFDGVFGSENGVSAWNPFEEWIKNFDDGIKEFNYVTSMVNTAFNDIWGIFKQFGENLKPLMPIANLFIKLVSTIISGLGRVIQYILKFINWLGNIMSFGLLGWLSDLQDSTTKLSDEQQKETERLKALNEQYKSLKEAIEEQEEYYLKKRREVNAQTYKDELVGNDYSTSVNDMILTPNGKFSTHPDDTIIAMKHPESLGGANIKFTNVINNNASDIVQVAARQETDDEGNAVNIIEISRAVASDYAIGANGWDSAALYREQRNAGRRVTI